MMFINKDIGNQQNATILKTLKNIKLFSFLCSTAIAKLSIIKGTLFILCIIEVIYHYRKK